MGFSTLDSNGLVWEREGATGPGLHALLIGVGRYPSASDPAPDRAEYRHPDLDAPAITAAAIARFLIEQQDSLTAPLHTVRLLASPTHLEISKDPSLTGLLAATRANVRNAAAAWQASAGRHRDGTTLFYFGGHGIQRSRGDAVLLLEDFLDPGGVTLERTIDLNNLYNAMAPSRTYPDMAMTQFYFLDACRVSLPALEKLATTAIAPILEHFAENQDARLATKYFAAAPGTQTFCRTGGLTLFGEDLLACLVNDAGDSVRIDGAKTWLVTVNSLAQALYRRNDLWNKKFSPSPKYNRYFALDSETDLGLALLRLEKPPKVRCRFRVAPSEALNYAEIVCRRGARPVNGFPLFPVSPHPHECELEMGGYEIRANRRGLEPDQLAQADDDTVEIVMITPPEFEHEFRFA